jgi:hypothetical protein
VNLKRFKLNRKELKAKTMVASRYRKGKRESEFVITVGKVFGL